MKCDFRGSMDKQEIVEYIQNEVIILEDLNDMFPSIPGINEVRNSLLSLNRDLLNDIKSE